MLQRTLSGAVALAATLCLTIAVAQAWDDTKYPDINGQWVRAHPRSQWDPSKPRGLGQQAPLSPEYQAIFEANLAALHSGSLEVDPQVQCLPSGMPRMMIAYEPIEIMVTGKATYIRTDHLSEFRRIYTDGRDWPAELLPSFWGYSIGKWIEAGGGGRYDALTRPWTVTRSYKRERNPVWPEYLCTEDNHHVRIGKEFYFQNADGYLMPTRKDQPPPDLRYFTPSRK